MEIRGRTSWWHVAARPHPVLRVGWRFSVVWAMASFSSRDPVDGESVERAVAVRPRPRRRPDIAPWADTGECEPFNWPSREILNSGAYPRRNGPVRHRSGDLDSDGVPDLVAVDTAMEHAGCSPDRRGPIRRRMTSRPVHSDRHGHRDWNHDGRADFAFISPLARGGGSLVVGRQHGGRRIRSCCPPPSSGATLPERGQGTTTEITDADLAVVWFSSSSDVYVFHGRGDGTFDFRGGLPQGRIPRPWRSPI